MSPIESLQLAIEDHDQSIAGVLVTPRQHTWILERAGAWTRVRLSHIGTTPRRYAGTGDESDDIAMHYRLTGYGDYQVSDLFSTWKLSMLVEPWDVGTPCPLAFEGRCETGKLSQTVAVLMDQAIVWFNRELNVSLASPDDDSLTADEICCEASIAVCSGLGGLRDRGAEVQNMIQNSFERVILSHIAETSPRNVIEIAARAIRGMSWDGLLEAAKMAGIEIPK